MQGCWRRPVWRSPLHLESYSDVGAEALRILLSNPRPDFTPSRFEFESKERSEMKAGVASLCERLQQKRGEGDAK
jgi:hypothetical protein